MSDVLKSYYSGKKVLITGDTGFKGSWLTWWMHRLGADLHGIALPPDTNPSLFLEAGLSEVINHTDLDIRNQEAVHAYITALKPDFIFHLAAQPIVRESYTDPVSTFSTNVLGTAHILDAMRSLENLCTGVMITSDKCYENAEWTFSYREIDPMGGHDPYSASKGCSELVISSFHRSFFDNNSSTVKIASARAGNVIGAGDWAKDRIIPDIVNALHEDKPVGIRSPKAVRPWQHVLEPLSGYLWLGAKLYGDQSGKFSGAWNFGPAHSETKTVAELANEAIKAWGSGRWEDMSDPSQPHEAKLLRLSIDKAVYNLDWQPVWNFATTIERTLQGYRDILGSPGNRESTRFRLSEDIQIYTEDAADHDILWAIDTQKR